MSEIDAFLQQLEDYRSRSRAMNHLRRMGAKVVPHLLPLLNHPLEGVRWSAVTLLGEIGDPAAIAQLKRMKDDPHIGYQVLEVIDRLEKLHDVKEVETPATVEKEAATEPPAASERTFENDEELINAAVKNADWSLERNPDGWSVLVHLPHGRKQSIRCIFQESSKGSPLVIVYTKCGPAKESLYEAALKLNLRLPFGAVAVRESEGQKLFVMVNSFLRETLTPLQLKKSVERLAKEADALEKRLSSGKDEY